MAARVVIVADDLTGAMDVAGPLADRGLPTLAVASHEGCKPADLETGTVISINADTRHLSAADAARRTHRIASELVDAGAQILIKKIDSTLRGNVVSETLAMLDATRRSAAVVAPAFPGQGRTVREGVVHVDGAPLSGTNFARDALSPPPLQPLHLLFTRAAQGAAVQLLRPSQSPELIADQRQILVFDAQTDADLEQIVRNLQGDLQRVLLVGSAGIAQAVGKVCFPASAPAALAWGARSTAGDRGLTRAAERGASAPPVAGRRRAAVRCARWCDRHRRGSEGEGSDPRGAGDRRARRGRGRCRRSRRSPG